MISLQRSMRSGRRFNGSGNTAASLAAWSRSIFLAPTP
jgi:hypothetical protein